VSGFTRLLRRLAGRALGYTDYECEAEPARQGPNVLWAKCTVRIASDGGQPRSVALFGTLIERDGHWKLMSFANDF
jgi:hypothetical protein